MAPRPSHHSSIYRDELWKLGNGRPIWHPEIDVSLGDVVFFDSAPDNGSFRHLFNILKSAQEQQKDPKYLLKLPGAFKELECPENLLSRVSGAINSGPHASTSVVSNSGSVEAQGGGGVASAHAYLGFTCRSATGALLFMEDKGDRDLFSNNKCWPKYIMSNLAAWEEVLEAGPFQCTIEDLIFARGYVKTSTWKVAAWASGKTSRGVALDAGVPATVTVGGGYRNEVDVLVAPQSRECDRGREEAPSMYPRDQTVFLSYYQVKRRLHFFKKLEAAAGYDSLRDPSPPSSSSGAVYVTTETEEDDEGGIEDPLDPAFRYIFENCTAEVACLCEGDIDCLLQGQRWPANLYQRLHELNPRIEVFDDAAIFSIEDMVNIPRGPPPGAPGPPGNMKTQRENIRGGSLTFGRTAQERRSIEWHHAVLMQDNDDHGAPGSIAVSNNGEWVAIGYEDSAVEVWDIKNESPMFSRIVHDESVLCVSFSPDSKILASGSSDGTLVIWDTENAVPIERFYAGEAAICSLAFSPDGTTLATGSTDMILKLWNPNALKQRQEGYVTELNNLDSSIQALAFSPDSTRLVSCTDQTAHIRDGRSGQVLFPMNGHEGVIWALDISHRGHRIATGGEDHTARIWNMETGDELVTICQHADAVWSVHFTPDDEYVITGSNDTFIAIHRASTGEFCRVLAGHESPIHAAAYSPVGNILASGDEDGILLLWDVVKGEQIAELRGHADKINTITFSNDRDNLITSSNDGTVRVWSTVDMMRVFD